MKKLVFILIAISLVCSCHNDKNQVKTEFRTYQDAEADFVSSLTQVDTASVIFLANSFVNALQAGNISGALDMLYCVEDNVVYKIADSYYNELAARFESFPVGEFELDHYSFSTAGDNDLCYKYAIASDKPVSNPVKMKIMFNPVKVGDLWYLTFKDGNMNSKDLDAKNQTHPYSLAPSEPVLNKQN